MKLLILGFGPLDLGRNLILMLPQVSGIEILGPIQVKSTVFFLVLLGVELAEVGLKEKNVVLGDVIGEHETFDWSHFLLHYTYLLYHIPQKLNFLDFQSENPFFFRKKCRFRLFYD